MAFFSLRPWCAEDIAQIADVVLEGAAALLRERDAGARALGDEVLFDGDVAGVFQRGDMGAEIAFRRLDDGLQAYELDRLAGRQDLERSHQFQAHRLVDDAVGLFHGQARRSQRPVTTSVMPPTPAIQSRECWMQEIEAAERQRRDGGAGDDEAHPHPDPEDRRRRRCDQQRNEGRVLLARVAGRRMFITTLMKTTMTIQVATMRQPMRRWPRRRVGGVAGAPPEDRGGDKGEEQQGGPDACSGIGRPDVAGGVADHPDETPDEEERRGRFVAVRLEAAALGLFDIRAGLSAASLAGHGHGIPLSR